ncbi:1,4-dihydroxy-2-naphthoyl-CoA hydrolase [Fodinibius salinus]|uniref:1,4-dihydroxy-2-naphthoyl-CoA hydrolase n=1 Tax=Fodinibius salinus TaxID=860790 RepID=A0A5D3YQB3_9BACT|nr:hotdog fold thioesterase [Fodinibius salinus]TYP94741.1 1,4-dihydroxy-2-naphthoyl-CoA hydrolase [Fodinibius salinus]
MYIQPEIKNRVKTFLDAPQQHMGDVLNISFTSFKTDEVKASMPVDKNTIQPFGLLHGGASVTLAETLASVGAWLNLDNNDQSAVGIEINANHMRAVKKGREVSGVSTPIHKGRSVQVWETKITNSRNQLVCSSRCTLAVVDR